MRVVPQAFFGSPTAEMIMADGLSCVIRKTVTQADNNNERFLAAPALTLVLSGHLLIETEELGQVTVSEGEFVFLPRNLYMISDIIPDSGPFSAIVYFLAEDLLEQFIQSENIRPSAPLTQASKSHLLIARQDEDLRLFTNTLVRLYENRETLNSAALTKQKLFELLHLLVRSQHGPAFLRKITQLRSRHRKSLTKFMQANYDKPLSVADYAFLTGRSLSTFHRDFKRLFNIGPKEWLTSRRLERAKELLQHPTGNIRDIALSVGYENLSHFIRVFRKRFNITPKQFQIAERSRQKI